VLAGSLWANRQQPDRLGPGDFTAIALCWKHRQKPITGDNGGHLLLGVRTIACRRHVKTDPGAATEF
jgi:hypothetical protein